MGSDVPSKTLYLGNIDERTAPALLYELCLQAGPIVKFSAPNQDGNRSRFMFCEYEELEDAVYAWALLKRNVKLNGKDLNVGFAKAGAVDSVNSLQGSAKVLYTQGSKLHVMENQQQYSQLPGSYSPASAQNRSAYNTPAPSPLNPQHMAHAAGYADRSPGMHLHQSFSAPVLLGNDVHRQRPTPTYTHGTPNPMAVDAPQGSPSPYAQASPYSQARPQAPPMYAQQQPQQYRNY